MAAASNTSSNTANGNTVILSLVVVGLAVASIFTKWGNAAVTAEEVTRHTDSLVDRLAGVAAVALTNGRIPLNGQSQIPLFGMEIPIWLFSTLVIAGGVIAAANASRYASLPRAVPIILCAIGVLFALFMLLGVLDGGLEIGVILFAAAAATGLFISFKRA